MHNPFFWGKMSAIVVVALLSIPPTLIFLGWRKKLHSDSGFTPLDEAVARPRRLWLVAIDQFEMWMPLTSASPSRFERR